MGHENFEEVVLGGETERVGASSFSDTEPEIIIEAETVASPEARIAILATIRAKMKSIGILITNVKGNNGVIEKIREQSSSVESWAATQQEKNGSDTKVVLISGLRNLLDLINSDESKISHDQKVKLAQPVFAAQEEVEKLKY